MYLLGSRMKPLIVLTLFILVVLSVNGHVAGQAKDEETIEVDSYTLTITRESKKREDEIEKSEVRCGANRKTIPAEISERFHMAIEEELLKDLLEIFDEEYKGEPSVDHLKLRRQILGKIRKIEHKQILRGDSVQIIIKPLQCYERQAVIEYKEDIYKVDTKKRGVFGTSESSFEWREYVSYVIIVESEYKETGCEGCRIQGKKDAVKGKNDEQLYALIQYEHGYQYLIPLYWRDEGSTIKLKDLLPDEERGELIDLRIVAPIRE